jgi:Fe(3+) dicitrate transport protein
MKSGQIRAERQRTAALRCAVTLLGICAAASSPRAQQTEASPTELPRVNVLGSARELSEAAGSAAVIDGQTLEESRVFSVNEALRKVPGVHVREEEGVGLRPNIGIRGMNPTRSTKTLLLEDGLPLSYAPYGDNASYYHPPIDRYESIEVSKGSQVIRFGPQTAGGLINYITPEPQRELGGFVGLSAGTHGYLNGHMMVTGNGAIADIYHKESDGARDNMHSRLDDLNFKWAGQLNEDNKLVLRATHFQEHSQLTYSGLTQAEYQQLGPRYNPFKNDFFDANRTGLSATHEWRLNSDVKVLTSVYGAYFDRDWWRQASTTTGSLSCANGAGAGLRNAGTSLTDADLKACRYEGRLRNYTTKGIDSRMFQNHSSLGFDHQLEVGVKYQREDQRRRQEDFHESGGIGGYQRYLNGAAAAVSENRERNTDAYSIFAANKTQFTERLAITPIVRVEHIRHEHIQRDASNIITEQGRATFTEWVPGIGATYQLNANNTIYGGVHRGFSPPRTEDAISGSTTQDVNAEKSVNAELGLRSTLTRDAAVDIAIFRNDFSNLVQVGSIAGGSTAYTQGKALYQGIELAGQLDRLSGSVDGNLFLRFSVTHLPTAEQKSTFSSTIEGTVFSGGIGKRLPYAPENLATVTIGYRAPQNWNARVEYVYVGKQYSDFENTVAGSTAGQAGEIPSYGIWNAVANYTVGKATFFIAGKNLGDATYIVDRTRGIQVGMPRTVQAGMKYAF